MSICELDRWNVASTIGLVGREDRALLRSNPSAWTDAGTGAGVWLRPNSRCPSLFWPESDKPWGFGGQAPKTNPGAVCQLSRSEGRRNAPPAPLRGSGFPARPQPPGWRPELLAAVPAGLKNTPPPATARRGGARRPGSTARHPPRKPLPPQPRDAFSPASKRIAPRSNREWAGPFAIRANIPRRPGD